MASVEQSLREAIEATIEEYGYDYFYLSDALVGASLEALKETLGETQEKLLGEMEALRVRLFASQRREEALAETLRELQLAEQEKATDTGE